MPAGKGLPAPDALAALDRLRAQFELTVRELDDLLHAPQLPTRFAGAAATLDLLERFRELQLLGGTVPLAPSVSGVEMTQAIQYFRPPVTLSAVSGPTGVQTENSLPLVAGKPTILRAFLQDVTDVSGTIEWRAVGSAAWSPPTPALNGPLATLSSDVLASRSSAGGSLNFRLPAAACAGTLDVRLTFTGVVHSQGRILWDLQGHAHFVRDIGTLWNATELRQISFESINPLGIRLVRMRYEGRGLSLAAPSVADFWATAVQLRRMYPLSDICLWRESEVTYDGDFSDITPGAQHLPGTPNGGTFGDWLHIMNNMSALENAPSAVRYVMLYPNGALGASPSSGWAVGRTALTPVSVQSSLAHEVGHLVGRPHAPCGGPAGPDPWYPTFGSYGPASIGEFGVDIATLDIMDPATFRDFMSYCGPAWISPYQYGHIRNWLLINPGPTTCVQNAPAAFVRSAHEADSEGSRERLALTLQIDRSGRVRLAQPCFHVPMPSTADEGVKTDYFVELRREGGEVLSAIRLWLQDAHVTLDDAVTSYFALIPWDAMASEVVVLSGHEVLERFSIDATAPRLSKPVWSDTKGATVRRLDWRCDTPAARFAVRYSADGGETWGTVSTWLERPSCAIDLATLPAGDAGIVEIVASAGFRTSRRSVKVGRVARAARVATIISPLPKLVARAGETVVFLGHAISKDGEARVGSLEWSSSRDGVLGTGRELLVHTLSPGRHVITLGADDGVGGVVRATRTISVQA